MASSTGGTGKKTYTFWESFAWHWKSRKFRSTFAAMLTIILVKCTWVQNFLGIKPEDTTTIVQVVMLGLGMLLMTITGEKWIASNGNGHIDPKEMTTEVLDKAEKKALGIIDDKIGEIDKKVKEKLREKLGDKAGPIVDELLDKVKEEITDKLEEELSERVNKLEEEAHGILDKLEEKMTGGGS